MSLIGLKCNEISLSLFYTIVSVNSFYGFMFYQLCVTYMPPYTHRQQYINEDKIIPNTDNFMIFAILYFYNFMLVMDTTLQNNDKEISLRFKSMRLIL